MSAYPVFISVGFTFLVQITFICPCADCIYELAYSMHSFIHLKGKIISLNKKDQLKTKHYTKKTIQIETKKLYKAPQGSKWYLSHENTVDFKDIGNRDEWNKQGETRQKEINKYTIFLFHVKYTNRKALVKYKKIKEKELFCRLHSSPGDVTYIYHHNIVCAWGLEPRYRVREGPFCDSL